MIDETLPDRCLACTEPVLPADVAGQRVWLDAEIQPAPAPGMVAYNPATGNGRHLTLIDLDHVPAWQAKGVSIHHPHAQTCSPQPVLQGFDHAQEPPPSTLTRTDGHHPDCTFTPMHEAMRAEGIEPTPYAVERGDELGVYTCHPDCDHFVTGAA